MAIPQDARHLANQEGDWAPQHQNQWAIEIAGLEGDDKELIILSILSGALPNESNDEVELPYGNEKRYVAGQATYETIPLVVRDFVDRETRRALIRWRRLVYNPETGNVGLPSAYKKNAEIVLYATDGSILRKCRLIGVWPQALNGGDLSMESSDPVQMELTLRYDRAVWAL
jgi:hypothetical protein